MERGFKRLLETFREDSKLVDFDIGSQDEIPPMRFVLNDIEEAQEAIDRLAGEAFEKIRPDLPQDLQKKDRVSLSGPFIGVHVRAADAIVYDLSWSEDASGAKSLANFLFKKAKKISESPSISIVGATKLTVADVIRSDEYAIARIESSW
ncbi:MAG: hypothetical protein ACE5OY_01085 [Candidatus Bathyarchaeia archaeon]